MAPGALKWPLGGVEVRGRGTVLLQTQLTVGVRYRQTTDSLWGPRTYGKHLWILKRSVPRSLTVNGFLPRGVYSMGPKRFTRYTNTTYSMTVQYYTLYGTVVQLSAIMILYGTR